MKNVLMGAVAVGVAYLIVRDYQRSKKKCKCSDTAMSPASTAPAASTGDTTPPPATTTSNTAALNFDGFQKRW